MHRLTALLLCLMFVLSLATGSVAHATEGLACVDTVSTTSYEHSDGDGDEVPGDAGKAYPHHHGECHGHHIGVPLAAYAALAMTEAGVAPLPWDDRSRSPAPSDAALRPPQA